ncbi:hypothetical protein FJZ53_01310 [Candidatus Woesearchaeota archaeon]|nr:hypothetical protein [Candidatus Woesearchaeota archaeon]
MKSTTLTRETITEEVSKVCYSIDNNYEKLKDYKPKIAEVVVPFSTICKSPTDGLLNCLNEFMQVAKQYKLDEEEAINYGLLHLNDMYKNRLSQHSIIQKAKEIKKALQTGKYEGEKLLGFWSTWGEESADAVALFNTKFAITKNVPIKDLVTKAEGLYKKIEKQDFEGNIAAIFAAKYLDEILKGELNEDALVETAKKLCKTAEEYPKMEWDSEEAEKLMICYSGKIANGSLNLDRLVEAASEVYEYAKKKNKDINKGKWDHDIAVEISLSHTGRVIEKGMKADGLIKELNDSYKFFESALPKTEGWIFKSNDEIAKSATMMYTIINNSGLKTEDIENDVVNEIVNNQIEEELTNNLVMMNMMMMTIMVMNMTIATSASTSS